MTTWKPRVLLCSLLVLSSFSPTGGLLARPISHQHQRPPVKPTGKLFLTRYVGKGKNFTYKCKISFYNGSLYKVLFSKSLFRCKLFTTRHHVILRVIKNGGDLPTKGAGWLAFDTRTGKARILAKKWSWKRLRKRHSRNAVIDFGGLWNDGSAFWNIHGMYDLYVFKKRGKRRFRGYYGKLGGYQFATLPNRNSFLVTWGRKGKESMDFIDVIPRKKMKLYWAPKGKKFRKVFSHAGIQKVRFTAGGSFVVFMVPVKNKYGKGWKLYRFNLRTKRKTLLRMIPTYSRGTPRLYGWANSQWVVYMDRTRRSRRNRYGTSVFYRHNVLTNKRYPLPIRVGRFWPTKTSQSGFLVLRGYANRRTRLKPWKVLDVVTGRFVHRKSYPSYINGLVFFPFP